MRSAVPVGPVAGPSARETLVCWGEYVLSPLECAMHAACLHCCIDQGYGHVARGLLTQGATWVDRTPLFPHPAGALDGVGGY